MPVLIVVHLIIGIGLLVLGLQLWANWRTMPRLCPAGLPSPAPHISVLVPARNEGGKIARCVRAWSAQEYPDYELLIYDDDSLDDTAARAAAAAPATGRMCVLHGGPLPAGWRGKPYACHQLRRRARGDLLVFADADVIPEAGVLSATATAVTRLGVDVLSAVPRQVSPRPLLRALAVLQNWSALTVVPSWVAATPLQRVSAAINGQFLVIRPTVYDAVGGFEAVRDSLAEDAALGRRLAAARFRAPLFDGSALLVCEPYVTLRQLWEANVRNLLPIFFDSVGVLSLAMGLLATLYLGPIVVLVQGFTSAVGDRLLWTWLPLAEIVVGLSLRRVVDVRCKYPAWLTLLHPLAIGGLVAMAMGSVRRYRGRHSVEWRGRRYRLGKLA